MSTRAVYTFKDSEREYHVYKHHDGYPSGAIQWISGAIHYGWKLPRFEAAEFAAAFIAANKTKEGGVYCTTHYSDHNDLEYRYEIECKGADLIITAFDYYGNGQIFRGTLKEWSDFQRNVKIDDKEFY